MLGDAELGRQDVPVVNALAHLHLGAAVPSARREGIHFLQQSLALGTFRDSQKSALY